MSKNTSTTTVTPDEARAEIIRREFPKGQRPKPASQAAFALGGAELRAIVQAEKSTPAPAKVKPGRKADPAKALATKVATQVAQAQEGGFTMRAMIRERSRILSAGELKAVRAEAKKVLTLVK